MGEKGNWQKWNEGDGNLAGKRKSDRGAKDGFRMRAQMEKKKVVGERGEERERGRERYDKEGPRKPPTSSRGREGRWNLEAMSGRGEG